MKKYESYSRIEAKKIDWLWYPYIPSGKITLLQGDPGEGKSTFMIQLLAILTRGGTLPDGQKVPYAQTVIYQCAEDSKADTVKPRLISAGADCERVLFIDDTDTSVTLEDDRLEETLRETKAKLLVLDPLQAFIPADADMQSATKMRAILRKLSLIAARYGCAIVLVGHMNKSYAGKNLYRGLGSIDIPAIARSVLMIQREETEAQIRYMFPVKSSLAPEGDAIAFMMHPQYGFQWIGKYVPEEKNLDENSLVWSSRAERKEQLCQYMKMILAEQDLPSLEVFRRMEGIGASRRTTQAIGKEVGAVSYRKGGAWHWSLKKRESEDE